MDQIQLNAYRMLAEKVLEEYQMEYDNLMFLRQSENVTFCMQARDTQEKYLVRIHKSIEQDDPYQGNASLIHSELLLLEELNRSARFTVQVPVKNKAGAFVTQVMDELSDRKLNATVLKWVDGEVFDINDKQYDGLAYKLGKEMAEIHEHLMHWKTPKEFSRMQYGLDESRVILGRLKKLVDHGIITGISYEDIYENAAGMLDFIEKNLPKKENWGLIHGDLNEGNYVTDGKNVYFIDFSRCGYGYFLYDIAQTLMHLAGENRQLFMKGYQSAFEVPQHYEKLIDCFFALSIIDNMLFLASNPEEHDYVGKMANYLCNSVIRNYKENKRVAML